VRGAEIWRTGLLLIARRVQRDTDDDQDDHESDDRSNRFHLECSDVSYSPLYLPVKDQSGQA
jgi:hypothetical protein